MKFTEEQPPSKINGDLVIALGLFAVLSLIGAVLGLD